MDCSLAMWLSLQKLFQAGPEQTIQLRHHSNGTHYILTTPTNAEWPRGQKLEMDLTHHSPQSQCQKQVSCLFGKGSASEHAKRVMVVNFTPSFILCSSFGCSPKPYLRRPIFKGSPHFMATPCRGRTEWRDQTI